MTSLLSSAILKAQTNLTVFDSNLRHYNLYDAATEKKKLCELSFSFVYLSMGSVFLHLNTCCVHCDEIHN